MMIDINYLRVYQKQIDNLTAEFSELKQVATVSAPQKDVENFVTALHQLEAVIQSISRPA